MKTKTSPFDYFKVSTVLTLLCVVALMVLNTFQISFLNYIISGIIAGTIIFLMIKSWNSDRKISEEISKLSQLSSDEDWRSQLATLRDRDTEADQFIASLINGEESKPFSALSSQSGVGQSLVNLKEKLALYKQEDEKRNWSQGGLAKFSELMKQGKTLEEFSFMIISKVVKYVSANQGGLFVAAEDDENGRYMYLAGCYAYDRKKYQDKKIAEGAGLLGEVMLAQSVIYMTDIPLDYVHITSGLGQATPRNIIILPLMFNNKFYGAIELASFTILKPHERDFLQKVSEIIGAEIATRRTVQDTEKLLTESTRLTGELQSQEEEMRQHVEELTATQEEMLRNQAELNSIFSAINNTVASLEFDLRGNILKANSIFTDVSGYTEKELQQLEYQQILDAADRGKPQHDMMWSNLRSGQFFSGEFRFDRKDGEDMWLSGTFNPVFNSKGEVQKVIMIAHFTTQDKVKHNELTTVLNALKSSVAYVELGPDLVCRTANDRFFKLFGVKRIELKNRSFHSFLEATNKTGFLNDQRKLLPGQFIEQELKYSVNDTTLALRTSFTPVKDQQDNVVRIIVVIQDELEHAKAAVAAVA